MTKHVKSRRDDIVGEIRGFTEEFGHPPTVRYLVPRVGLASTSALHYQLGRLIAERRLEYCPCGCRAVRLTGSAS